MTQFLEIISSIMGYQFHFVVNTHGSNTLKLPGMWACLDF